MKLISLCIAMGLGGLAAAYHPARAGDLYNDGAGGIRDYGAGGIPAPMPQTYNETFKWYVRADVGTAFKNTGTLGSDGMMPINVISPTDWQPQSIISFGFGRYISPSFRVEYTLDYHTDRSIAGKNLNTADTVLTKTTVGGGVTQVDIGLYHGLQNEDMSYQNSTFLMSGFYDFNRGGWLHPYVGAGVGFARHVLTRNGTELYTCDTTNNVSSSTVGGVTTANSCGLLPASLTATSSGSNTGYGLAAQASAGISYDLSPRTHWDTGYRLVWQSGNLYMPSTNGLTSVHLGDQINHEVRTGVRWDLW